MLKRVDNTGRGIIFALITAILSGVAILYSKLSLIKIKPLVLTTSRNFYVGLLFLIIFLLTKKRKEFKKLKSKEVILLFLIGLIGGSLPFYLFFTGLQYVSPLSANFIHKTLFIWVSFLAAVFLRERFNLIYFLSYSLLIIAHFSFNPLPNFFGRGQLMILSATFLWSIENVLAKYVLKKVSSEMVGLFRMGIGSLLLFLISLTSGGISEFTRLDISRLVVILTGGSILFGYVFFWYKAVKYAPVSLVAMVLSFSLVVGTVLKAVLIGIRIPSPTVDNIFLITIAVLMVVFKEIIWPLLSLKVFKGKVYE